MAFLTAKQKMGAAAVIMGLSVLLSRFMGLARDKVISWQFGAGAETDVYFAAFVIPDFLNYLLAGGYLSITLIPMLSRLFREDEEDAWRLFGTVVTLASLAIGVLSLAAWIAAPVLAPMVAPGFSEEKLAHLSSFLRIILPAQVFFLPGACFTAILYIRNQFSVPALTPLVYNGCILLCGALFPACGLADGMEGFCWGVLSGAFLGSLVLPFRAVLAGGGFRWRPGLKHRLLKKFLLLALPLMLGQSVVVLDEQFIRIFGSMAGDGAVSLLSYARRIMMVPVGVVAQAAGVASFPFLAGLLAAGKEGEFVGTLNSALRNSLIIVIPVIMYMAAAAEPTLGFIFEGGSFTAEKTAAAAPLLGMMLCSVPFWLLQQILGRSFYAGQDTVTPALAGTFATLICIPAYAWLSPRFGALAVAFMGVLSVALYAVILMFLARRRYGCGLFRDLIKTAVRGAAAGIPALAAAAACIKFLPGLLAERVAVGALAEQIIVIAVSGSGFTAVWFAAARYVAPDHVRVVLSPFRKLAGRKK